MDKHDSFASQFNGQKEFILVKVQNPTIHNTHDEGRFTTYEVSLQTNSPSFALKQSVVERRYSDFVWLRKCLARTTDIKPPSLPFIGRIFKTFEPEFLTERQQILTEFMRLIVRETQFLSNTALHLFLQTDLKRPQMDEILKDAKRRGSMDGITRAVALYGAVRPTKALRSSSSNISMAQSPSAKNLGFGYSQSAPTFKRIPSLISPGNFDQLRKVSEAPASDGCLSTSGGSDRGYMLPNNSINMDTDSSWVVLDNVSSEDGDTEPMPSDDVINSEKAYTEVTWKVNRSDDRLSHRNSPCPMLTSSPMCSLALPKRFTSPESHQLSRSLENMDRSFQSEAIDQSPPHGEMTKNRVHSNDDRDPNADSRVNFSLGGTPVLLPKIVTKAPSVETNSTPPTDEIAEVPTDEVAEVPTDEVADVPSHEVAEVPADEVAEVSTDEVAEVPTDEVAEVPTDEVAEVPTDEVTEVPTDEVAEVPTDEVAEVPTDEVAEVSTDEVTEVSTSNGLPANIPTIDEKSMTSSDVSLPGKNGLKAASAESNSFENLDQAATEPRAVNSSEPIAIKTDFELDEAIECDSDRRSPSISEAVPTSTSRLSRVASPLSKKPITSSPDSGLGDCDDVTRDETSPAVLDKSAVSLTAPLIVVKANR